MSDGGKGSKQRPGVGYANGWDAIFGKKEKAQNFLFTSGQHVIFKLDDPKHELDFLRDYVVHESYMEKKPNGKCFISLKGEQGFFDQEYFEDFGEWASHQRRAVE